jgi:SRSO17 transposase
MAFQSKPQIAVDLLRAAKKNGAPKRPVVADAGYGDSRDFRDAVTELGWEYAVAISSNTTVWPPGSRPQTPKRTGKGGRPAVRDQDPGGAQPIRVDRLAQKAWDNAQFRKATWRNGSKRALSSRFCALRVQSAERRTKQTPAGPVVWLLIERDDSQPTKFKYYLSSLPRNTAVKRLARFVKMRWRIERDYQDMKQKLGLDNYEGRQWGGFHRHFAMVALMHAFLSLHRESFSPRGEIDCLDLGRLQPSCA